jgi:hypothetical protein
LSTYVHIFAPPSNKYLKIKRLNLTSKRPNSVLAYGPNNQLIEFTPVQMLLAKIP